MHSAQWINKGTNNESEIDSRYKRHNKGYVQSSIEQFLFSRKQYQFQQNIVGLPAASVVAKPVNQFCENHLCAHHQLPDNKDKDGSRNVLLLALRPPDLADSQRIFYWI